MRRAALSTIVLIILLSGCASDKSLSDVLSGDKVKGDQDSVIVQADAVADAFPLAVGHCAHFKRSAQYDRPSGGQAFRFLCVPG